MSDALKRQEAIVEWLSNKPEIGIPMRTGTGFYINKGTTLKLKSGQVVEVIDWLKEEGIHHGMHIAGYQLVHGVATDKFREKISFFKKVVSEVSETPVEAPFGLP